MQSLSPGQQKGAAAPVCRLDEIDQLSRIREPLVLAVGMFDGLHLGHQEVLRQAFRVAGDEARVVVVTFEPHPATVLARPSRPQILMHLPYKERLLRRLGVDCLLVIRFDDRFAAQEPTEFVRQLTAHATDLRAIVVGRDWAFGRRRSGDVALLERLGQDAGFKVVGVPAVEWQDEKISSTRIRMSLETGDLGVCRDLLGRPFSVLGTVVAGRRLGRQLGFPTANLDVHGDQLPPTGVYAVRARPLPDAPEPGNHFMAAPEVPDWQPAVANLGVRPTVTDGTAIPVPTVEVHLLDAAPAFDLYGHELEVEFVERLRDEQKFAGLEELKDQIARDIEAARRMDV